ncbi:DNA polymerase III subunit gamma/tau [Dolosigranulum pigrum]|uniref:DNA-directed DNA polymerase n=1 Tax=Dolosigranulum pigrum ATCC 51524 TaxID=883103 RepID=H3NCD3_9LACT|nr:DNA polymerase III subunit gamma/tau [Dolosigranulum pigrum]EHR35366.1 DNA polymerase III, subunit gamma and tau [Dolosigranulum pigrum ATCC 51524]
MSYQALYRVWRPQSFDDVLGQDVVVQTLKNAVAQGNTSHAYLFSGPRGTGKTSVAKILAKAINCPYAEDGQPCNECHLCTEITKGALGDVIEIDAASNNGVDEIRDIREKAQYAPTQAPYKVYIIDEVHMLSTGAFNALLKTLEEPPQNVIFILATTEPHKIPATIISRLQRFDFKRILPQVIIERLEHVLGADEITYDADALVVIANAAEGGMRDALSLLDQALSFMDEQLTVDDALQITGSITQERLLDYIQQIADRQTEVALSILSEVLAEGKDPARFIEDTILLVRDMLLYQQNNGGIEPKLAIIGEPFQEVATNLAPEVAYRLIQVFNETGRELRQSNHADIYLEVATVKLTQQVAKSSDLSAQAAQEVAQSEDVADLKQQLEVLKTQIKQLNTNAQASQTTQASTKRAKPKRKSRGEFKVNLAQVHRVLANATKQNLAELQDIWGDLIHSLDTSSRAILNNSKPVAASPEALVVTFEFPILCEKAEGDEELKQGIVQFLDKVIGTQPDLVCIPEAKWPTIRQNYIKQMKEQSDQSDTQGHTETNGQSEPIEETNPAIATAVELFGRDNIEIKD